MTEGPRSCIVERHTSQDSISTNFYNTKFVTLTAKGGLVTSYSRTTPP